NLHLFIPFAAPTAGAVFSRDGSIWLVFDGDAPINTGQIAKESTGLVLDVKSLTLDGGRAIRMRLARPQLSSVSSDGNASVIGISDTSQSSPQPLVAIRNIADNARANVSIPITGASKLMRFSDPDT